MQKSKFSVTVNTKEGFKVSFDAEDKETIEVYKYLTEKLFDKIEKGGIELKLGTNNEEY